jgi:hypothetical protein
MEFNVLVAVTVLKHPTIEDIGNLRYFPWGIHYGHLSSHS